MEDKTDTKAGREIELLDLLLAIAREKKFVISFTLIFAIAAVIFSLITPQKWISQTTFQAVAEGGSGLSMDLGLLDMIGGGGLLPNSKADQSKQFVTIMQSRTFSEDIVRKYGLIEYFKIDEPDSLKEMEKAVRVFKANMARLSLDPKTDVLTLIVETKNKNLSRKIAQYMVEKLDRYNRYDKMTKGSIKRIFLEKNVSTVQHKIDSLGVAIKDFQKKYHAIAPDQQTQALLGLYSEAVSTQIETEFELDLAKQTMNPLSPQIKTLEKKKELLDKRVSNLENEHTILSPKYILQIDNIPDISLRYAKLMMELEIQKKIFELLYPQYEAAKIDEMKDTPTIEIIDDANLAGFRSKPKRAFLVILVTLAAFILSSVIAIILGYMSESQKEKINLIMTELTGKKKI